MVSARKPPTLSAGISDTAPTRKEPEPEPVPTISSRPEVVSAPQANRSGATDHSQPAASGTDSR